MFCVFSALQSRNSVEVCAALQPGGRASGRWDVPTQLSRPSRHGGGLHQRGTRVQRLPVPGLLPLPLSVQAGSEQSVKHAVTILTDAQLESFHCGFQTNRSRSNQHKNTYQILPYYSQHTVNHQTQSLNFIPFSLFRSDRCLFFVPLTCVGDFLFLEMCCA